MTYLKYHGRPVLFLRWHRKCVGRFPGYVVIETDQGVVKTIRADLVTVEVAS